MEALIVESTFGILAFDERGRIVDKELFPRNVDRVAEILDGISDGKLPDEVIKVVERLRKRGCSKFIFEDAKLAESASEKIGVESGAQVPSLLRAKVHEKIERLIVESGFAKDRRDFLGFLREVSIALARRRIKTAIKEKDSLIIQAIRTNDELTKTLNLLSLRVRNWYGLHFPELDKLVDRHDVYLRLIANLGGRENFTYDALLKEKLLKEKAKVISEASAKSVGIEFTQEEMKRVREVSKALLDLYKLRRSVEDHIEDLMEEFAPNLRAIAGPLLGARLIAVAGGLSRLAEMPASKIQILGAEKALFRSLKTGAKPPKHGLIFQHPDVHSTEERQRGKIARLLASKIALATRADAYTGRDVALSLIEDYKRRLKEVLNR